MVFTSLILLYTLYTAIKLFVNFSQIKFLKNFQIKHGEFDVGDMEKAKEYATQKERFVAFEAVFEFAIFCFWIFVGISILSPLLSAQSIASQTLGVLLFLTISFVLELPIKIAFVFGLDKKFDFTRVTPSLFVTDKIKELLLTVVVGGLLSLAAIYFINSFSLWWLWVFALIATFMVGANILYPNFIAPIFNKFEKLENDEITSGLKELAHKSGFELSEIYRVDAGKRDTRLNAYFAGLGRTKRVALYDTLIEKLSHKQIFAVVAHELGHFKHKHIFASIGVMLSAFFALCFLLGSLGDSFYSSLGMSQNGAGAIVVFMLFSTPLLYVVMPLINFIYKKNEFQADAYAAQMGLKDAMIEALKTLSKENRAFPFASQIKIFFDYTHPPITDRIEKLRNV